MRCFLKAPWTRKIPESLIHPVVVPKLHKGQGPRLKSMVGHRLLLCPRLLLCSLMHSRAGSKNSSKAERSCYIGKLGADGSRRNSNRRQQLGWRAGESTVPASTTICSSALGFLCRPANSQTLAIGLAHVVVPGTRDAAHLTSGTFRLILLTLTYRSRGSELLP